MTEQLHQLRERVRCITVVVHDDDVAAGGYVLDRAAGRVVNDILDHPRQTNNECRAFTCFAALDLYRPVMHLDDALYQCQSEAQTTVCPCQRLFALNERLKKFRQKLGIYAGPGIADPDLNAFVDDLQTERYPPRGWCELGGISKQVTNHLSYSSWIGDYPDRELRHVRREANVQRLEHSTFVFSRTSHKVCQVHALKP